MMCRVKLHAVLWSGAMMGCGLFWPVDVGADAGAPLSAKDSDPVKMEWMTGFPPSADKLIMQPESDFFSFPKLRWTVCHIRELMPTKRISGFIQRRQAHCRNPQTIPAQTDISNICRPSDNMEITAMHLDIKRSTPMHWGGLFHAYPAKVLPICCQIVYGAGWERSRTPI